MKIYTQHQLCYFARFVIQQHRDTDPSLQSLFSILQIWERDRPNESTPIEATVDERLKMDLDLYGNAYYELIDGKKRRIDPLTMNIISVNR